MQVGEKLKTLLADVELEVHNIVRPGETDPVLVDATGNPLKRVPLVELGGEQGTPVQAVADGVVTHVGGPEAGVEVRAADGTTYHYGHVEAPNVHEQQTVTAGRTLAQIALDPGQRAHVRFAVFGPDGWVDPEPHLTPPPADEPGVTASSEANAPVSEPPPPVEIGPGSAPVHLEPTPAPALLPSAEDMAAQLRAAGWTVQPPATPAPIPGGGNPSL